MQEPNREKSDGDLTVLDKIAQVSEDPFDLNRRTLSSSLDLKLFHLSNQNNDSLEPASKRRKLDDLLKAFETSGKVIDLTKDDSPKSSVTHGREAFETSEKVIDLTSSDDESLKDSATGEIQQIDQQPRISDEDEPAIVENSNNSSTTEKGKPQIIEALNNLGFEVDEVFRKVLKTHQVEGLKFMWQRVYEKRGGCLLAHSMGLGKTLQTIALLTSIYQALNRAPESDNPTGKRVLIIAPLITLSNWANEFGKWAIPDAENVIGEVFNFAELEYGFGNRRLRYAKYWYDQGGIMLINYDMFRSLVATTKYSGDKDEYFEMFINPGPDIVILDEAHRIKNSSSALSSLISRMHTRSRICLTGYPLQNHISEYYDMISFVAPGLLGSSKSFKGFFRNDIERCYADSSLSIKKQAAMKMYILQLLTDVVTHRRDGSVLNLDLPPKTEYVIRFKLSPFQLEGYKNLIELSQAMNPLVGLLTLRAICNHPKIFKNLMKNRQIKQRNLELDKEYGKTAFSDDTYIPSTAISARRNSNSDAEDEDIENLDTADIAEDNEVDAFAAFLTRGHEWAIKYLDRDEVETWKCSGKMSFIVELAKNCHVIKEKLLIVSHSLACLEYIEGLLPVLDIKTLRIDGSTSFGERQEIIDKFQLKEDIDVMLLSAKAAAIGINLTAANRIVLVDQDWNPLYDEQSIGRVFRYGQDKPVFVYRLITASTIEERIFAQSVHKKSISRRVIDNKPSLVISKDELVDYFVAPDGSISTIDLNDDVIDDIRRDYITFSTLKESTDSIVDIKTYEIDKLEADDLDVDNPYYSLSPLDRRQAKKEAKQLMQKWWMNDDAIHD